jgi:hypothetical protein
MQPMWLNDIKHLIGVRRFIEKIAVNGQAFLPDSGCLV